MTELCILELNFKTLKQPSMKKTLGLSSFTGILMCTLRLCKILVAFFKWFEVFFCHALNFVEIG